MARLARGDFIWFDNFHRVLFEFPFSERTINAFKHNIFVFFALMLLQNGLGFILAYCLWRELWAHAFTASPSFCQWCFPPSSSACSGNCSIIRSSVR